MKKIISILIILLVGFLVFNYSGKPEDVAVVETEEVKEEVEVGESYSFSSFSFEFTGYGPAGKTHSGSVNSELMDNVIVFDMNTVETGSEKLNEHLCANDFFYCEEFPESKFTLESIDEMSGDTVAITGVYSMKGVDKRITFTADIIDDIYAGQFLLDTTDFGFSTTSVEPQVLITFKFSFYDESN